MTMEQIAKACGVDVEEVRGFNPQYKTSFIPGGRRRCVIALPEEVSVKFVGIEDSIYRSSVALDNLAAQNTDSTTVQNSVVADIDNVQPAEPAYGKRTSSTVTSGKRSGRSARKSERSRRSKSVTIRQGDNLGAIAARNGTTVAALKKLNNLRGDNIRAGRKLRVK